MNKLNNDILENIYKNISTKRSKTIVNYIAMLMALARDNELNEDDLINWIHSKLSEIGYFQEKNRIFTQNKLDEFVLEFIEGRALLYDDISITETKQNKTNMSSVANCGTKRIHLRVFFILVLTLKIFRTMHKNLLK